MRFANLAIALTLITQFAQGASPKPDTVPDWHKQLEIGLIGSSGNSESQNFHAQVSAKQATPELRREANAAFDMEKKDREKSREEFYATLNQDWLLSGSPWFYFAQGRFDWDDFKDWDYRANVAGGTGYDFITREDWTLRGKTGLGFNREFGGKDHSIATEAIFEASSNWMFSAHHKLELKTTWYPQLDEISEYRNINTLSWLYKLNDTMRFKVGLIHEHDSDVPDGIKRDDFTYATSLVWDI